MSIEKCIFCEYAVIHKDYDRATNVVIACRQHQDIFAPVCEYQFINTEAEPTQTNASNALNALATRWIPVTERKPKKGDTVIVTDFGSVTLAYVNDLGEWMDFDGNRLKGVTAWMPLPQPWKGEDYEID